MLIASRRADTVHCKAGACNLAGHRVGASRIFNREPHINHCNDQVLSLIIVRILSILVLSILVLSVLVLSNFWSAERAVTRTTFIEEVYDHA